MKNEGTLDRLLRLFVSVILFLLAYFWLGGTLSIVFYILGIIVLFTAFTGFCLLYKFIGFNTLNLGTSKKWPKITMIVLLVAVIIGGTYGSIFFTRKFFLEDYNKMNNYYKQTLFLTGQNQREEAVLNYNKFVSELPVFQEKYTKYKPFVIKSDKSFESDLINVGNIASGIADDITAGDLSAVHTTLESIRPIFQDMLKRNGFSMLAVALVDFHDAMEEALTPAENKDAEGVIAVYSAVDAKLKEVEALADDAEIQKIRKNLEDLNNLAKQGSADELPAKGALLKSSFVKVYLKRG